MERQDRLLQVRASLGRWRDEDGKWLYLKPRESAQFGDSRQYTAKLFLRSYKPIRTFDLTEYEAINLLKICRKNGMAQTEMLFPELDQFFRNGKPICDALELEEYLDELPIDPSLLDSFEALIAEW